MSGFNYNKWDNIVDSDDEESAPKKVPVQPASSAPAPAATNSGGDDNMSEVEKLKIKKRAQRAAREAREAANPSAASASAESLVMEEVAEALPSVDTNAADAVQSSSNAEKELTQAESTVASMKAEIASLKVELPSKTPDNAADLKKRTLALQGQVGKLQMTIDEIFLGEIEDETVRAAAKARRKAINALCEGWFPEEIGALKKLC
jgi:SpoU rRNA methylase family enzyme